VVNGGWADDILPILVVAIALVALTSGGHVPALSREMVAHKPLSSRSLAVPWSDTYASTDYLLRPDAALPWHLLKVRLETPRTVALNSRLNYVVDLTNSTLNVIALSPCPAYTQIFGGGDGVDNRLNCRAAPLLFPHETVRFAMHIRAPGLPQNAVLDWRVDFRPNRNPHALSQIRVTSTSS
jgi:hypothetical protein